MIKIAYSPVYRHPLPEDHRFPMLKYERIPHQLVQEGLIDANALFEPLPCELEVLTLTHTPAYVDGLMHGTLDEKMFRKIGFPWSRGLFERERILIQGTIDCAKYAKDHGVSLNVAGGTHHAFADRGEGFCLMNDMAVAANYLLHHRLAKRILIIDLDVHQGNGTARIFNNRPEVFTFSMHGKGNYPFHKEQSDLDIELEDGTDDNSYLGLLELHLSAIFEQHKPDMIFYQAGVDILASDRFGKIAVTPEGCVHRDALVFSYCKKSGTPVAVSMGGGYSPNLDDVVTAHCRTFKSAIQTFFT
ncbi:MAG: histone deacetylase [Bacteroidia bacterium]|jgi:acetoin utilization deacetylase AcuC-like enzyme